MIVKESKLKFFGEIFVLESPELKKDFFTNRLSLENRRENYSIDINQIWNINIS